MEAVTALLNALAAGLEWFVVLWLSLALALLIWTGSPLALLLLGSVAWWRMRR